MKPISYFYVLIAGLLFIVSCTDENRQKSKSAKLEITQAAKNINADFVTIRKEVKNLADFTESLYASPDKSLLNEKRDKYKYSDNGIFYKAENDGKSAVYVSGIVPITREIKDIVYFTAPLEDKFIAIMDSIPEIAQIYYNDKNSYNRIYPYIDVLTQYGPKMSIPSYNFYYLADYEHNPEKKAVWVHDPYVDPAGRGWMVSAIAPVYVEDELAGVPGIDVTINTIIDRYLSGNLKDVVIIDNSGVIVAADETSANRLFLPPLKDHKYVETIKTDKFRKDDYNLLKSKNNDVRLLAGEILNGSQDEIYFSTGEEEFNVVKAKIEEVRWVMFKLIKID